MLRTIRLIAVLLVAVLGGLWTFAWATRAPNEGMAEAFLGRLGALGGGPAALPTAGGALPPPAPLGGAFSLVDQSGRPVTEQDFTGRWMLVYFGYTFCPDVCPTELGIMAEAVDAMGPAGGKVSLVFITIDPQRDTPAALADYVSRFHPRMQGLTGSPEQIAEVARRYRVYYSKSAQGDTTDYTMNHSGLVYLIGPDSRVRLLFRPAMGPEEMAAAIAAQMGVAARPG